MSHRVARFDTVVVAFGSDLPGQRFASAQVALPMLRVCGCHRRASLWIAAAWFAVVGGWAQGAVTGTAGTVRAQVQELVAGQPGSVNSDDAGSGPGVAFPILASVELSSTDLSGAPVSLARGLGLYDDPARLPQANPEEFGVEAACYSDSESVSYLTTAEAVEIRTLLFSSGILPGFPAEIGFDGNGERTVVSRVFLSGAVILWSQQDFDDGAAISADISFAVQVDGTDEVLSAGVVVQTNAQGLVDAVARGGLILRRVGIVELAAAGVAPETLAILGAVQQAGRLVIVVFPEQELTYSYTARADQAMDLRAKLAVELRNAPGGSGVAAVVGRPFSDLAEFIVRGFPGANGQQVEQSINAKMLEPLEPVERADDVSAGASRATGLCGALGGEALGLMLMGIAPLGVLSGQRRRWNRSKL